MEQEVIMNILKELIREHFIAELAINEVAEDKPLTGSDFNLDAIEMYQLLMCIENTFHIYFTPEELRIYGFRTLSEIAHAVFQKTA